MKSEVGMIWRLPSVLLLLCICMFAGESPFSGTWRFNPTKGHPIQPLPRSAIAHVEVNGEVFNFSEELVDLNGKSTNMSYRAGFDGQDYPIMGQPEYDTVSLRRVNEHEINFTFKKTGTVMLKINAIVSRDGETTTYSYTDYHTGKPHNGSSVYERQ